MSTRRTIFAVYWAGMILSSTLLTGCARFGTIGEEVTLYDRAKVEFENALDTALIEGMVPSVPSS